MNKSRKNTESLIKNKRLFLLKNQQKRDIRSADGWEEPQRSYYFGIYLFCFFSYIFFLLTKLSNLAGKDFL